MTITALPTPPSPSDSPATFNSKAFDLLGALPTFVTEANGLEAENAAAASAAATAAATAALASKLDATNPSYTGTLTGGTGVINIGSGQFVKDASGNVGIGDVPTPTSAKSLDINGGAASSRVLLRASVATSATSIWTLNTTDSSIDFDSNAWGTRWRLGGTTQMTLDAAGNFGLGVTPSAANLPTVESTYGIFAGTTEANILQNCYYESAFKYKNAGDPAGRYLIDGGVHSWYTAPSGTAGNPITFTQAMTLDASGNLLVGTTTNSGYGAHVFNTASGNSNALALTNANASTPFGLAISYTAAAPNGTGNNFISCSDTGAVRFKVLSNGNAQNLNNSYGAISDLKLKENITDASPKLAKLMQVRIVNYTLKSDPTKAKLIGVVAQELEQISPGLIEETPDYKEVKKTREVEVPAVDAVLDDEGNEVTPATKATTRTEEYTERVPLGTVTKSVKYSVFVPMLIKGMQEQQAQIEAQAVVIEAMQAQLDTQNHAIALLTARLEALEAA